LVGWGIKFLSHLTTEAKAYIEKSDKLLYLVNDPVAKDWLQKSNPHAESLDALYQSHPSRDKCYQAIADYILQEVRQNQHLCVVLYGHAILILTFIALESVGVGRFIFRLLSQLDKLHAN